MATFDSIAVFANGGNGQGHERALTLDSTEVILHQGSFEWFLPTIQSGTPSVQQLSRPLLFTTA